MLAAAVSWTSALLRSFAKVVLRLASGKCELERITTATTSSPPRAGEDERVRLVREWTRRVRDSLVRSKQLGDVRRRVVVECAAFSVLAEARAIVDRKRFANRTVNPGLRAALTMLRRTNVGLEHLVRLAATPFQKANGDSESNDDAKLRVLWERLRPGETLQGSLHNSPQWSDLGFQGKDPVTDFRGAGILSLNNLVYFATRTSPDPATGFTMQLILQRHCRDVTQGGFPLALVGINITAYLLSLAATKRCLDDEFVLFLNAEEEDTVLTLRPAASDPRSGGGDETTPLLAAAGNGDNEDDSPSNDDATRAQALEHFNALYVACFCLFARLWREAAPRDAMGFPLVFGTFKREVDRLAGEGRLLASV